MTRHLEPTPPAPPDAPPLGLCLPVVITSVRDGDTVCVQLRGSERVFAIRLLDCWAPERHSAPGRRATNYMRNIMRESADEDVRLFIPLGEQVDQYNIFDALTFDRVLGHVYIGHLTLTRMLIRAGLASSTRDGELGQ